MEKEEVRGAEDGQKDVENETGREEKSGVHEKGTDRAGIYEERKRE